MKINVRLPHDLDPETSLSDHNVTIPMLLAMPNSCRSSDRNFSRPCYQLSLLSSQPGNQLPCRNHIQALLLTSVAPMVNIFAELEASKIRDNFLTATILFITLNPSSTSDELTAIIFHILSKIFFIFNISIINSQ